MGFRQEVSITRPAQVKCVILLFVGGMSLRQTVGGVKPAKRKELQAARQTLSMTISYLVDRIKIFRQPGRVDIA